MENILFKVAFPAEFHAQTAVECAIKLNQYINNKMQDIDKIELKTQEPAIRIISKTGPLHNPADRDHCIQYMVAVALLQGDLKAEYYEDGFAADTRIDNLRAKIQVQENPQFSLDYLDPNKRSIGNSLQIFFKDGSSTEKISIEYPIGHQRRRAEAISLLFDKFKTNLAGDFRPAQIDQLISIFADLKALEKMPITALMDLLVQ